MYTLHTKLLYPAENSVQRRKLVHQQKLCDLQACGHIFKYTMCYVFLKFMIRINFRETYKGQKSIDLGGNLLIVIGLTVTLTCLFSFLYTEHTFLSEDIFHTL